MKFKIAVFLVLAVAKPSIPAWATSDSSSDAPMGFGQAIEGAQGVLLRVPINERGDENTDGSEIRFLNQDRIFASENIDELWQLAAAVETSNILLGTTGPEVDPRSDSSTWGWSYWWHRGWVRPYYYFNYYPTFYYNNHWYYYGYYRYWNWGGYRYYFYYRTW